MKSSTKRPVVLVVEDEPLILMMTMDIVDDEGFSAIPAPTADEAMCILVSRDDVRFVITDVNMPGSMDGVGLARAVSDRWPPIKILVTSGRELSDLHLLPAGCRFLAKPCSPRKIAQVLHDFAN